MNDQTVTLPSTNPGWGFHGAMTKHAGMAWPLAMTEIMRATGHEAAAVRAFLDSATGKHFADEVLNSLQFAPLERAIASAVQAWMTWRINRQMARHFGVDSGQPYLTGFVTLAWNERRARMEATAAGE